jgi:hypothetical protein
MTRKSGTDFHDHAIDKQSRTVTRFNRIGSRLSMNARPICPTVPPLVDKQAAGCDKKPKGIQSYLI